MMYKPGSIKSTNSVTTGHFQATILSRTCIFIMRVIVVQRISVFSFWFKFAFLTYFMQAEQNIEKTLRKECNKNV